MLALLLALQAAAAPASAPAAPREVVVTGRRLSETEAALAACLARHCPTDQDVDATLAHAENQFVAGDYKQARGTILASLARNKRAAARYPVALGDLWRANGRVAIHLGEATAYRTSAIASLDALRAGLPADDARVLAQRVEVADAFAHLGQSDTAADMYAAVADRARKLGLPRVEGYALLRRVVLFASVDAALHLGPTPRLTAAVAALTARPDPALARFADAARLTEARLKVRAGDAAALDALLARFRERPTVRPMLLYAPRLDLPDSGRAFTGGETLAAISMGDDEDQWVDLAFWVRPDGSVAEVDQLRGSKALNPYWVKPVKAAIAGRRYAPLALDPTDPGVLRVERYTRTAHLVATTGSRMRVRQGYPRIEVLDLTDDSRPPAPAG
jgi:tetratricopeptide (TPR) repeat protein